MTTELKYIAKEGEGGRNQRRDEHIKLRQWFPDDMAVGKPWRIQ